MKATIFPVDSTETMLKTVIPFIKRMITMLVVGLLDFSKRRIMKMTKIQVVKWKSLVVNTIILKMVTGRTEKP